MEFKGKKSNYVNVANPNRFIDLNNPTNRFMIQSRSSLKVAPVYSKIITVMEIEKSDENLIEEAIFLNNKKLYQDALVILLGLEEKYQESSTISGLIATAYFLSKEFEISAGYYKRTTALNPKSELASLGLFHSLWELKDYKGAYKEMDRFLSENEPVNYKVTLKELHGKLRKKTPLYQTNIIETYYKKYV
jgi:tetratricopeptide (TPR) repeat protein